MPHTLSSLESLPDRDLDTIVGDIVFRGNPPRVMGWAPAAPMEKPVLLFSSDWNALLHVIQQMRERFFKPDMKPLAGDVMEFGWTRFVVTEGRNRWCCTHSSIPRAAAIAAILAVQGHD